MTPFALPLALLATLLLPTEAFAQSSGYGKPRATPKKTAAKAQPAAKAPPAARTSPFCLAMRKLPWSSPDRIRKLISVVEPRRTTIPGTSEADLAQEAAALEGLVTPARLSGQLKSKLAETKQPGGDYAVVTPPSGAMYHFGSTGGSLNCRFDVWGQRFDDQIVYAGEGPDLGESCAVERLFGSHRGEPILVQYELAPKDRDAARKATSMAPTPARPAEVKVVQTDKAKWGDVCAYKLK